MCAFQSEIYRAKRFINITECGIICLIFVEINTFWAQLGPIISWIEALTITNGLAVNAATLKECTQTNSLTTLEEYS